jgi:dTDP-alpha-D-glucuronic acid decarboxylase
MRNSSILVTGGSGFVGSHLVEELLARENRVTVFDHVPPAEAGNLASCIRHPRLTYVQGDIRDKAALARTFEADPAAVFHLSAVVGVKHYVSDPLGVIDINVGGTRNLLELAARRNVKVLLTSTSEVYGKNPKIPWAEDDDRVLGSTAVDRWSYSTSKAICEHMLLGMHKALGLPATVVRYFNVYGPRQNPIYVVSQSVYKVLRGEPCVLYDGGMQTRCFTYVKDAVEGTIRAATDPRGNGQVFNIGNPRESTIREVLETILRLSGKNVGWTDLDTRKHYGDRYEDIPRRVPDVSKARRLLDWQATTTLEDGLGHLIAWARNTPGWSEVVAR